MLYKLWKGYGEHKWFGKWGEGKDWRWYGYRLWMWLGSKSGYLRKYNIEKQVSLDNARMVLEEAFTPQLKSMIEKELMCNECGSYIGESK